MADQRIIDYIRENRAKYPLHALKDALIKQGYAPDDVDAAAEAAAKGTTAPPVPEPKPGVPSPTAPAAPASAIALSPSTLFANARTMFTAPESFFSRLDPEAGVSSAVVNIMIWAFLSGGLFAAVSVSIPGTDKFHKVAAVLQIVIFPMVAVVFSFIAAGIYHLLCRLLGGKAPFTGSYQVIGASAALFPLSALTGIIPYGNIPVQLYGMYLSIQSAAGMHKVAKPKAWAAFGLLTAFGIMGSIGATMLGDDFRKQAGIPLTMTEEGQQAIENAVADMGADTPGEEIPAALSEADEALKVLKIYEDMPAPPDDLLERLKDPALSKLKSAWPGLSGPVRKAVTETLETTPEGKQAETLEQMLTASKDMDAAISQGQKNIRKLRDQQERSKGR